MCSKYSQNIDQVNWLCIMIFLGQTVTVEQDDLLNVKQDTRYCYINVIRSSKNCELFNEYMFVKQESKIFKQI